MNQQQQQQRYIRYKRSDVLRWFQLNPVFYELKMPIFYQRGVIEQSDLNLF